MVDTAEHLEQLLSGYTRLPLPPESQKLGNTNVGWEEVESGSFVVHTRGGTVDDRRFARHIVSTQLSNYGLEEAQFVLFPAERTSSYDDVEAKALRYWTGGAVKVLTNTADKVAGEVDGDTGTWQPEFDRQDPNSGAISLWHCTCPWNQFAWQRTRKWKYLEGRPCAHVIALYWASQATPLDEEYDPQAGATVGPGGQLGFGDSAFQRSLTPTGVPRSPTPQPSDQQLSIPGVFPEQGEMPQPPGPNIIPPFQGYPPPPVPVSVPGGKQPSPENPVQSPGGTFSSVQYPIDLGSYARSTSFKQAKQIDSEIEWYPQDTWEWARMAAEQTFQNSDIVRLLEDEHGIAEGKSPAHGAGEYHSILERTKGVGEVLGQDPTTGWVDVIFPLDDTGPMEPYHLRAWIDPSKLQLLPNTPKPGPFIKRR